MRKDSTPDRLKKIVGRLGIAVTALAIVIRVVAGHALFAGHSGAWWTGLLMLAVIGSRLGSALLDVRAQRLAWTRLLLPMLVVIELLLYLVGRASRSAIVAVLVLLELALIITTVVVLFVRRGKPAGTRYWEERVQLALTRFIPAALARLVAGELSIVGAAITSPFRRKTPPRPNEFGYFAGSPLRWIPFLLLLAMPPDVLLVHVIVPPKYALVRWLITGSGLYALLWAVGIGVTMRRRPHHVGADVVDAYYGVLRRARWSCRDIEDVVVRQPISSRRELRAQGGAALLASSRMPLVEVTLSEPTCVHRVFGADGAPTKRLLIAVDEPDAFRQALLGASTNSRRGRQ